MKHIRNALFAAATLAAAFGTSAVVTKADAGWGWGIGFGKVHGFHLKVKKQRYYNHCWAWNGYQWIWVCPAY